MKEFVVNSYGGVDILENDRFLLHLSDDDMAALFQFQQRRGDLQTVRDRIPDWVMEDLEEDDFFFEDFNSHLFSGDEISEQEIYQKILKNGDLLEEIAIEYRSTIDYNEEHWFDALNEAIEKYVSVPDVLGEILQEKRPKELEVGRWRILVIEQGDLYGTDSHKVPWKDEEPCVEFYDLKGRVGQQWTTGRFYIQDLVCPKQPTFTLSLDEMVEQGKGLVLNPNIADWVVAPAELNIVNVWLKAVYVQSQAKAQAKVADVIANVQSRAGEGLSRGQGKDIVLE